MLLNTLRPRVSPTAVLTAETTSTSTKRRTIRLDDLWTPGTTIPSAPRSQLSSSSTSKGASATAATSAAGLSRTRVPSDIKQPPSASQPVTDTSIQMKLASNRPFPAGTQTNPQAALDGFIDFVLRSSKPDEKTVPGAEDVTIGAEDVTIDVDDVCFPVCTHFVKCTRSTGESASLRCSGKDIADLLIATGRNGEKTLHPYWEHVRQHVEQKETSSSTRSCNYKKTRPGFVQITTLKATILKRKRETIEALLRSGKLTPEGSRAQLMSHGILKKDGTYVNYVVAPRVKATSHATQFRDAALNRVNKNRRKSFRPIQGAYDLQIQNVVCKACAKGGHSISESHLFYKYVYQRFPASSTCLRFPLCVISTYETAQIGIAGASSDYGGLIASHLLAYSHSMESGIDIPVTEFGPVNFTTSANIGYTIDLDRLVAHYIDRYPDRTINYDPEVIGMAQIKHRNGGNASVSKGTPAVNVYPSGKLCMVGFLTSNDIPKYAYEVNRIREFAAAAHAQTQAQAQTEERRGRPLAHEGAALRDRSASPDLGRRRDRDRSRSRSPSRVLPDGTDLDAIDRVPPGGADPYAISLE